MKRSARGMEIPTTVHCPAEQKNTTNRPCERSKPRLTSCRAHKKPMRDLAGTTGVEIRLHCSLALEPWHNPGGPGCGNFGAFGRLPIVRMTESIKRHARKPVTECSALDDMECGRASTADQRWWPVFQASWIRREQRTGLPREQLTLLRWRLGASNRVNRRNSIQYPDQRYHKSCSYLCREASIFASTRRLRVDGQVGCSRPISL